MNDSYLIRLVFIALIAFYVAYITSSKTLFNFGLFRSKSKLDNKSPLLLSYYSAGNDIMKVSSGEMAGVSFKTFMTVPGSFVGGEIPLMSGWDVIYMIELDFNTQAHIIGLGKHSFTESMKLKAKFADYHMEKISLEGDFDEYFDLYAAADQQSVVRYIFDPSAMQTYIDYCKDNYWEIVGDEMYVVVGGKGKDVNLMMQNASKFIDQIRPALIKTMPGDDPVYHEPSYGIYSGGPLQCPLCQVPMAIQKNTLICMNGHGVLLYGKDLIDLRHNRLKLDLPDPTRIDHQDLNCPNCHNLMSHTNYQGGQTIIDTCGVCHFRWIDGDEISKIKTRLPEIITTY